MHDPSPSRSTRQHDRRDGNGHCNYHCNRNDNDNCNRNDNDNDNDNCNRNRQPQLQPQLPYAETRRRRGAEEFGVAGMADLATSEMFLMTAARDAPGNIPSGRS